MNAPLRNIGEVVTFTAGVVYGIGDGKITPPEQILVTRIEHLEGEWYYSSNENPQIKFPESNILA